MTTKLPQVPAPSPSNEADHPAAAGSSAASRQRPARRRRGQSRGSAARVSPIPSPAPFPVPVARLRSSADPSLQPIHPTNSRQFRRDALWLRLLGRCLLFFCFAPSAADSSFASVGLMLATVLPAPGIAVVILNG